MLIDFINLFYTRHSNTEPGSGNHMSSKKLKSSRAVVCLCLSIHVVKWQKPDFLRMIFKFMII